MTGQVSVYSIGRRVLRWRIWTIYIGLGVPAAVSLEVISGRSPRIVFYSKLRPAINRVKNWL